MTVVFNDEDKGKPPGKLAEVELHFDTIPKETLERMHKALATTPLWKPYWQIEAQAVTLSGLKLVGFTLWQGKNSQPNNVTMPARIYTVGNERRSYALLRGIQDANSVQGIRDYILQAYEEREKGLR
jgi:hypothetical protein